MKMDSYTESPTNATDIKDINFHDAIAFSSELKILSVIIGWCYFSAWSISFYPQILTNFRRKSVVGLNFDFLSINVVGFFFYCIYNIGLYSIPSVQEEYSQRFGNLNPVELNDVFFSVHAVFATVITIIQCFIYDRGDQRVSNGARSILVIFFLSGIISSILAIVDVIHWLDVLYVCSYIKLGATLTKYVPQAYMNYRRKSTDGWSIGNILLDFTGGVLSILQMIINAYIYDDWESFLGNSTKIILGLFTLMFDTLFMLQHYVFYRSSRDKLAPTV